MEEKKGSNKIVLVLVIVLLIALSFGGGYLLNNKKNEKCVEEPTKEETKTDEPKEETKEEVKVTDQYVINTYGGAVRLYIISNGKVYYKFSKENDYFAGLNVCPKEKLYCKLNDTYNNDVTEITEIQNAKKIKMVIDFKASGEEFVYFVITSDNKVYKFKENGEMDSTNNTGYKVTGVNVTLIEELSNKNIVDLTDFNEDTEKYIFVTSDNTKIEY